MPIWAWKTIPEIISKESGGAIPQSACGRQLPFHKGYIYDRMGLVYEERRGTIKRLAEKLQGKGFVQIHRTYLISMFYVERFGSDEVKLKGVDKKLPVSRRYAPGFKEAFLEFVNKHARIV